MKTIAFKTTANNLHDHENTHNSLLDDPGGFHFSVKTGSLLACTIHELVEFIVAVVWAVVVIAPVVVIARRDIAVAMAQGGSAQMAAPQ